MPPNSRGVFDKGGTTREEEDEAITELLLALAGGEGLTIGVQCSLAGLPRVPAAPDKRPLQRQEEFDVSHALGMATNNNEDDNNDNNQNDDNDNGSTGR